MLITPEASSKAVRSQTFMYIGMTWDLVKMQM